MTLVRPAEASDVEAVAGLEAECLAGDAWSAALVREGITGGLPTVSYLVAVEDGSVVGHVVTSAAGDVAELQRIAVAAAHRRRGIGEQLLSAAVAKASLTPADRMLLEVRPDNRAALSFYAAQGFVEIDRRERYYADGASAVVMRLPLRRGCGAS